MAFGEMIFLPFYLYLFVVCAKEAIKGKGKLGDTFLIAALFMVPSAAFIHLESGWKPFAPGPFNSLSAWWVVPVVSTEGAPPTALNLVVAAFVASLLYVFSTLAVEVGAALYDRQGKYVHALHKAIIKWLIIIGGFFFYLTTQRVNLTPLVVGMGAASLVLGFALQETLSNLFAGLSIEAEGLAGSGEWIEVDGQLVGRVIDKGWRSTRIETMKNEMVVIPNRMLAAGHVINYNRPEPCHALIMKMGASYKDPPLKVKELLRHILLQERAILDDPPPRVFVSEYGDYFVNYSMMFWITDHGRRMEIEDAVNTKIWYAFHNHGVEIPFPVRTVQILNKTEREEIQEEIDSKTEELATFFQRIAALGNHLTIGECRYLARNSTESVSTPGDRIIKKGDPGDSVFFVYKGSCRVNLPNGETKALNPGEFFGEMALLTTAPRAADVWAAEEGATTIRVGKECMETMFEHHHDLKEEFERLKVRRVEEAGITGHRTLNASNGLFEKAVAFLREFLKPW